MPSGKIGPTGRFDSSPALLLLWAAEQEPLPAVHEEIHLGRFCVLMNEVRAGTVSDWPLRSRSPPPLAHILWDTSGAQPAPEGTHTGCLHTGFVFLCKLASNLHVPRSVTEWDLETFHVEGTSFLNLWMKKPRPRERAGGWCYTGRRQVYSWDPGQNVPSLSGRYLDELTHLVNCTGWFGYLIFLFVFLYFEKGWSRLAWNSLCNKGWLQTHGDLLASVSWVLGLSVHVLACYFSFR